MGQKPCVRGCLPGSHGKQQPPLEIQSEGRPPHPAEGSSVKCKLQAPRNTFSSAKREREEFQGLLVLLNLPSLALVLLANPSPTPTVPLAFLKQALPGQQPGCLALKEGPICGP